MGECPKTTHLIAANGAKADLRQWEALRDGLDEWVGWSEEGRQVGRSCLVSWRNNAVNSSLKSMLQEQDRRRGVMRRELMEEVVGRRYNHLQG